jgi:two-component system, sensor histidine kinase and response regulator
MMGARSQFAISRGNSTMARESVSPEPILDLEGTMSRLAGDKELFVDLVGFFFEDTPRLFAELQAAVNAKDAIGIHSSAHALKGLIAGCGGVRAALAAQKIETAGRENDLSKIDRHFELLSAEFGLLTQALSRYRS